MSKPQVGLQRVPSSRVAAERRAPTPGVRGARYALGVLIALLTLGSVADAQATITDLSVDQATLGTQFQITGTGFGTAKPKVTLSTAATPVKKTRLQVISSSSTLITVQVKKAIRGTFQVLVRPKGAAAVESVDSIEIVAPTITEFEDTSLFLPGDTTSMTVEYAGTSKPKVSVGGFKAKVLSVEDVEAGADDAPAPTSEVTFALPKNIPDGTWMIELRNPVGVGYTATGITVVGSTKALGKPRFTAMLQGAKPFRSTASVTTGYDGPTTLTAVKGGKTARTWRIVLPFVFGADVAPEAYTEDPASLYFEDLKTGDEWVTNGSEFSVLVGRLDNGIVAGSFGGLLYSAEADGGSSPRQVVGHFIYDGSFVLPDAGVTPTVIDAGSIAPRVEVQILGVDGATGVFGNAQPGDKLAVTFRLAKDDGSAWALGEMVRARGVISGPTSNYQRVVSVQSNVASMAVDNGDSSYTYTFPAIPDVYLAPLNDTASFGVDEGELSGLPLIDGTYTAMFWFEWSYSVGGSNYGQVGTTKHDFTLGTAPQLVVPREVVKTENCSQCHSTLEFHGGHRRTVDSCLMCHTAGAEDRNNPAFAGGTPGASIEFGVMIHKIHNGAHLPSVLGVTTFPDGSRDYEATPQPYQLVGYGNSIHEYDNVVFPAWPNLVSPMPEDMGYSDLDGDFQDLEDEMRSGVTNCGLCHGDPDGAGPLVAPLDGDQAFTDPTRRACASCHDDWVFDQIYAANNQTMPPVSDDDGCAQCHQDSGDTLAVRDAHLHPLLDPGFATGVVFDVLSIDEAGSHNTSDTIDPGEKIAVTFTVRDSLGVDIDPADLDRHRLMISGPTENMQVLVPEQVIPADVLVGSQPFVMNVPSRQHFEIVGTTTDGADEFTTTFTPHWNASSQDTEVRAHTGFTGDSTVLTAAVTPPINYIDVADASAWLPNDSEVDHFIAIDFGEAGVEYLQIQSVIGDRIWFSSPYTQGFAPGPLQSHDVGVSVEGVTLPLLTEDVEYSLTEATGTITESGGFADGNAIVVTYTSDFVMPSTYALPLNAGPDLTEASGNWAGKSMVSGTYHVGMWGHMDRSLSLVGESNSYRDGALGVREEFLVGSADELEPYELISDEANCYKCHVNIQFHGRGRTGFNSCIMCHGVAATGDRPQYVAPNAPLTDGITVNFREMLHKIHAGADLDDGENYSINGYGSGYPNNFSTHSYEQVHFPTMPSGTLDCASCHGVGNDAWQLPQERDHPTEQVAPMSEFTVVCSSCHDTPEARAHIEIQTSPITSVESCLTCHGEGQEWSLARLHVVR